ncbi:MAG: hypothetical protein RQ826_05280 [Xanthomonadales bacterium]|nr:hypothetical protein [Xanthomonadales bacterium]
MPFKKNMFAIPIRKQIRNHSVALVSIFIAVTSLAYNTWRNETTEHQRNIRHSAFRVLESLGELQEIVDARYYYLPFEQGQVSEGPSRIRGFGTVAMVRDLMYLMPPPASGAGAELHRLWLDHFVNLHLLDREGKHLASATLAEKTLSEAIKQARKSVLEVLVKLD